MTQDDEHLIADLKRRARDCDSLVDSYAASDTDDRARLRGKASAYMHAAELVASALQPQPSPVSPSREGAKPKHFSQMLGAFRGLDEPDPIFSETSPSPLSDRVERLEQALRSIASNMLQAGGSDWENECRRRQEIARAALGDGERG